MSVVNPATPGHVAAGAEPRLRTSSRNLGHDSLAVEPSLNGGLESDGPAPISSISLVIPVFNEEGNLDELHRRLTTVLDATELPYEILFVDDGSTDGTWQTIRALAAKDQHVAAVRHRRNFGKAQALALGFNAARGSVVVTMDGDLQDDPDELPRFLAMIADGYDVVSGWKQRRRDPLGKTFPSRVFNLAVRRVSGVPLHDFNCGYKAYRVEVVRSLRLYGELHRFTPVLAHAEGFKIGELPVTHHARRWGKSKYGWSRLVKGFLDLLTVKFLTEYRQRPMHVLGLPGIVAMSLGVLLGLCLVIERFVTGAAIGTRPLLSLAVLLAVIGAQFFGLGLLGELLAHISVPPARAPASGLPATVRDTLNFSDRSLGDA
jgi:glycosyltransferase involved in cell wall biosynthesis